jgi:hypothetical protein
MPDATRKVIEFIKTRVPLSARIGWVATVIPNHLWFSAINRLCLLQTWITKLLGRRNATLQDSLLLDYWLVQMTVHGSFQIPYTSEGSVHLLKNPDDRFGLVYCGVHLPGYTVAIRALDELGARPNFAIAAPVSIGSDGRYPLVGLSSRLPAIEPGISALVKTRSELARGGVVVSMIDNHIGEPLTSQLLKLAGKIGSRVVFFWTDRSDDGSIKVIFSSPPHPFCESESKVVENLAEIDNQRQRILQRLTRAAGTVT